MKTLFAAIALLMATALSFSAFGQSNYFELEADKPSLSYNLGETAWIKLTPNVSALPSGFAFDFETTVDGQVVNFTDFPGFKQYFIIMAQERSYEVKARAYTTDTVKKQNLTNAINETTRQIADIDELIANGDSNPALAREKARLTHLKAALQARLGQTRSLVQEKMLVLTAVNPAPFVTFTAASQSVQKGTNTQVTMTVQLDRPAPYNLTVPFTVSGTATAPPTANPDHDLPSGSVAFNQGETLKTLQFTISNSSTGYPKTVIVSLAPQTNTRPGANLVHTVTITAPTSSVTPITGIRIGIENDGPNAYVQVSGLGFTSSTVQYSAIKVNFGDGKTVTYPMNLYRSRDAIRHMYMPGTYTISMTPVDLAGVDGQGFSRTITITPGNRPQPKVTVTKAVSPGCGFTFDASQTTDPDGDTNLEYQWNFNDGTSEWVSTNPVVQRVFQSCNPTNPPNPAKVYSVRLRVQDQSLRRSENFIEFTVTAANNADLATKPVIVSKTSTNYGAAPLTVNFDVSKTFFPGISGDLEFAWNFGDDAFNAFATSANPVHTFTRAGTYVVVVRARRVGTSDSANSQTMTIPIYVGNSSTTMADSRIIALVAGVAQALDMDGSQASQRGLIDPSYTFWTNTDFPTYKVERAPRYLFASLAPGQEKPITISRTQVDIFTNIQSWTASSTASFLPHGPSGQLAVTPFETPINVPVSFALTNLSDTQGLPLTVLWANGNEVMAEGPAASLSQIQRTFSSSGLKNTNAFLTNSKGRSIRLATTNSATVGNGPSARLVANAYVGPMPMTVTLDGSSSVPGDSPIEQHYMNYGSPFDFLGGVSNQATNTVIFANAGTYPVVHMVKDTAGNVAMKNAVIYVFDPAEKPAAHVPPVADFSVNSTNLSVVYGATLQLGYTYKLFKWNFGDGTEAMTFEYLQQIHTYSAPGTYDVTLEVTDSWGETSSITKQVTVPTTRSGDVGPLMSTYSAEDERILRENSQIQQDLLREAIKIDPCQILEDRSACEAEGSKSRGVRR